MQGSVKQRLLAGGLWAGTGKFITIGCNLGVNALLSRLLPPADFGVYFLAFTTTVAGAMLVPLGQQQAIVRLVAESMGTGRPGRARAAIRAVYRYSAFSALIVGGLLLAGGGRWIAVAVFDSPLLAASVGLLVGWITIQAFINITSEAFRGLHDMRSSSLFGGVVSGLVSVAALGLLLSTRGRATLPEALGVSVLAGAISLAAGFTVLMRRVSRLDRPEPLPQSEVFAISLPMWITGMTGFMLRQSDIWILGAFRPAEEVAVYGAAVRLVNLVAMPLLLINLVVSPIVAEIYALGQRSRLERVLRNAAALSGVPAFLVLAAFVTLGAPILGLVFGEYYRAGAVVLALLSLGRLIVACTGSSGVAMNMTGHQSVLMRITLATSTCTVAGSLLVVQRFGPEGVAAVASAGTVIQAVWMWLAARRCTGMWTHLGFPSVRELRALFKGGG